MCYYVFWLVGFVLWVDDVVDCVAVHKFGAVHVAVDAVYVPLAGVLPHDIFVAVAYAGLVVLVECDEQRIVIKSPVGDVFVVEVDIGVEYRRYSQYD